MSNEAPQDRILSKVGDSRREFVRRVLVGAPFVAPLIASFTIGDLGVESALAQPAGLSALLTSGPALSCGPAPSPGPPLQDTGYVGPSEFEAYLLDHNTGVNGDVTITVHENHTIDVDIDMVKGALLTSAQLLRNSIAVVPNIPLTGNGRLGLTDTCGLANFDALLQALATNQIVVSVSGSYNSNNFSAQATLISAGKGVIEVKP